MRRRRSGGGGARVAWGVAAVRRLCARWARQVAMRAALLALPLAGGCGEEPPRAAREEGGAGAPAQTVEIPSGSAALPPSAGLAIPDTMESGPAAASEPQDELQAEDAESARRVVRDYYAAIAAGSYERAYGMWEDGGRRSGQTFLEFAAGFAGTERVRVEAGLPGLQEGAAGSRYVEVPVVVDATTRNGRRQRFEGTYTLRRSVVDGATEAQRGWRIYDAEIERVD